MNSVKTSSEPDNFESFSKRASEKQQQFLQAFLAIGYQI